MHINELPQEIINQILDLAAAANEEEGPTYTFGLLRHTPVPPPTPFSKVIVEKYVRGHLPTDYLKWDAANSIRQTCSRWHDWALTFSVRNLYINQRQRNDKWLELPHSRRRTSFGAYELMGRNLKGAAGHNDPLRPLKVTAKILVQNAKLAAGVERLWFGVLLSPEVESYMLDTICSCKNLKSLTVPWQALRSFSAANWNRIFKQTTLQSLEFTTIALPSYNTTETRHVNDHRSLRLIDFSQLRRLKFFGNATTNPLTDEDLLSIAQTATNLDEFHLTSISTITIAGVIAVVKASSQTLRVLEHSPRSHNGFDHPHPGQLPAAEHACEILANCPNLKDISVSLPSMCPVLFSNPAVKWQGDCQVRALGLCPESLKTPPASPVMAATTGTPRKTELKKKAKPTPNQLLRQVLTRARELCDTRTELRLRPLRMELFFADFIFEPHVYAVHGEFKWFREISGSWPATQMSVKGPYGATGWYGKDEGCFEQMEEWEFLERVPVVTAC